MALVPVGSERIWKAQAWLGNFLSHPQKKGSALSALCPPLYHKKRLVGISDNQRLPGSFEGIRRPIKASELGSQSTQAETQLKCSPESAMLRKGLKGHHDHALSEGPYLEANWPISSTASREVRLRSMAR